MVVSARHVYAVTLRKAHFYAKSRGVDPGTLLADTGLMPEDLDDPYNLISVEQARHYYLNLVNALGEDGVGLDIGWLTRLSDEGLHGISTLTERTAGEALQNSWKHRDNYNLLVDWKYQVSGNLIIVTVSSEESDPHLRTFLVERGLATFQANTEEIHGEGAKPLKVLLDYEAPDALEKHKDIFRCPLRFSQEHSQLYYPVEWADFLLHTYDPKAGELLGALRTSIHDKLSSSEDIVQDVKMALRRTPGRFPSLEQVASDLAMSSRTLHRKLGQRDVRFQDLLDAERRRVAEDLLSNTEMNVQQIAEKCGFAEPQNFSQAFRRWTGMAPSQFRASRK